MTVIQISTKDSFSVEELKKLTQCLREIEQNNPLRHINVFMNTPERTVGEMVDILGSVKPGMNVKAITKDGFYG